MLQHDIAYRDFKDLLRRTAGKVLRDKAFSIIKNKKIWILKRSCLNDLQFF